MLGPRDELERSSGARRAPRAARVVIVGAGPQGVSLVERLLANLGDVAPGMGLEIVLVDPFGAGSGRVWRPEQSPLMRMNSYARDVTLFPDESVECAGPARSGPALDAWAAEAAAGRWPVSDAGIAAEVATLEPMSFPTRRLPSAYLTWFFEQVTRQAPSNVKISCLRDRVRALSQSGIDKQHVWLASGAALDADVVVLALGNLPARASGECSELAAFAAERDLTYLPPSFTIDTDLSVLEPGAEVVARGFGLAFIDAVSLLTEGRGGRFVRDAEGLRYLPSGAEPRIYVGSRRGLPYRIKPQQSLCGSPLELPRFLSDQAVESLLARVSELDFGRAVWPLIERELAFAYYQELFTGYPGRATLPWQEFRALWERADATRAAELARAVIPDPNDHLDFERVRRPLGAFRRCELGALQRHVRGHLEADVSRHRDPNRSPDNAIYFALLSLFGQLEKIRPYLSARSQVEDLDARWLSLFHLFVSGPPDFRVEELIALSKAGVLVFLGAGLELTTDRARGVFRATGSWFKGGVETRAVLEARLPSPTVALTADGLLADLHAKGEVTEEVLRDAKDGFTRSTGRIAVDARGHVLDAASKPHASRFALGWNTSFGGPRAFAIPHTNAQSFRNCDVVARAVLGRLLEQASSGRAIEIHRC